MKLISIILDIDETKIHIKKEDAMDTRDSILEKLVAKSEEDTDFRSRLLTDPGSVLKETFDIEVPDDFNVVVHEEDGRTAHIVLPASVELTDTQLEKAAGGDGVCFFQGWWK